MEGRTNFCGLVLELDNGTLFCESEFGNRVLAKCCAAFSIRWRTSGQTLMIAFKI